jgi:5-methylcytosine-specific restriction endonuclease McrA
MKCLQCQTDLLRKDQKKFCSRSCSATFNNTGRRRHSKPESRHSMVKLCKSCGKETHRPVYCSDICNPKRLTLTKEEKQIRARSRQNEAWQRYMAKRKNQTPPNIDIKALQQFYLNCPKGYEVDHIIPISKGGLHTLENLQYLTAIENRKKSNKIL